MDYVVMKFIDTDQELNLYQGIIWLSCSKDVGVDSLNF